MIVKQQLRWARMLFIMRGSPLTRTLPRILLITAFSVFVTATELAYGLASYSLTITPFTIIGLAIGIFLGFRNDAAYDRYWEGRILWGSMVNSARSFTRQTLTLIRDPDSQSGTSEAVREFQDDLVRRMIAYVHTLRHHLRDSDPFEDIERILPGEDLSGLRQQVNVPVAILQDIGDRLQSALKNGWVSVYHLPVLEQSLVDVTNVQGGCERIKNTPIPFAYTVLTHRLVAFYCIFLPFGIIKTVGWLTPVVVMLISHAFFGLEEIGDEIEDPFGTELQHLPLEALCRTIEVNLLQAIGEREVPPLLEPVDGVLL